MNSPVPKKIPSGAKIIQQFCNYFSDDRAGRKAGTIPKLKKGRKSPYVGKLDRYTNEECTKIAETIDSIRVTCYQDVLSALDNTETRKNLHGCFKKTFKALSSVRLFGKLVGLEFVHIAAMVGVLPVEMVEFAIIAKDSPLYNMLVKVNPGLRLVKNWDDYSDYLLKTISYHLDITMMEAENLLCETLRTNLAYDEICPGQWVPYFDSNCLKAYVHGSKQPIILRGPTNETIGTKPLTATPAQSLEATIPRPFVFVKGAVITDMMPMVASMLHLYSAWILAYKPDADQKFLVRSMQNAHKCFPGYTNALTPNPSHATGPRTIVWGYRIPRDNLIFRSHTPFSVGECIDAFGGLVTFSNRRLVFFIKKKHAQQHFYLSALLRPDGRKVFFDIIVPHIFGLPLLDKDDTRKGSNGRVLFVRNGKNCGYCASFQKLPGGHIQIDMLDPSGRQRGKSIVVEKPPSNSTA